MNTLGPVDPDKLRARLTQAVEPVKPSPDALIRIKDGARKRRRLQWTIGSGAGVVAIAGATAAVIAVGSLGHPSASPRTINPGYSPTVSAAPTTTATPTPVRPLPRPSVSVVPIPPSIQPPATAAPSGSASQVPPSSGPLLTTHVPPLPAGTTTAAATTTAAPTSASPTSASVDPGLPAQHDLDSDGKDDVVTTEFLDSKTARLVMKTAGRTVRSAPFGLAQGTGAGQVTYIDISGSAGRAEVLIKDPGADGSNYLLFQYAGGQLVAVPAPAGVSQWLREGSTGTLVPLSFGGCRGGALTINEVRPTSMQKYLAGTDKTFIFSSVGYVFSYKGTVLKAFTGYGEAFLLTRAQALAKFAKAPNDMCGAQ